jgi:hypothetical protein
VPKAGMCGVNGCGRKQLMTAAAKNTLTKCRKFDVFQEHGTEATGLSVSRGSRDQKLTGDMDCLSGDDRLRLSHRGFTLLL